MLDLSRHAPLSVDDFRQRASVHVGTDGEEGGDYTFNRDLEGIIRENAKRDAAVLIGVHDRAETGEAHVLLTQRTDKLRTHSGQVAFPGGRIDDDDASPEAAALRECREETGISEAHGEIVGRLPVYLSGSGFRIHPVLAVLHGEFVISPNPDEVEQVFDVPLSFLMDEANHETHSRVWQGRERHFYAMPYHDHYIWGVTAGIIRMLYERLYR